MNAKREMSRTLVVSDLHLGDRGSLEDFYQDEAFAAFTAFYGKAGNAQLILNGDFIDYLQVQPLGALTVPAAVEKTRVVLERHGVVLKALADFTSAGNRLTVVEGNHDIELLFPKVRDAIRGALKEAGGDLEWFELTRSVVAEYPYFHIEHGHQADRLNRFDYGALLSNERTEALNLPWGSRFVHRVFNSIEPDYPFIDKIRPESAAALILYLVDRPLFRTLFVPFMGLKVEDWMGQLRLARSVAPDAYGKGSDCDGVWNAFAAQWSELWDFLERLERYGSQPSSGGAKGISDEAVSEIILSLNEAAKRPINSRTAYDAVAARKLAEQTGVQLIVYGHTHHAGRIDFGKGQSYINSGTWTALLNLPAKRETQAWLRKLGASENYPTINMPSFVEIRRDGPYQEAQLQYWDPRSNTVVAGGY